MLELIKFVPLLPLLGFITLGIFGKKIGNEKIIGIIGTSTVAISFLIAIAIFFNLANDASAKPHIVNMFTWFSAGNLSLDYAYQVDRLSIIFVLIITGVGSLIHLYSIGYMHGDRSFYRFFAYLNLFIFMMLNLVLGSNFLVTFLGWEGVGLASYLLIGFWYDRKFDGFRITWTGDAANKAFIMNRVGDVGMLIAIFLIFTHFGTLNYIQVSDFVAGDFSLYNTGLITAIALLLFLGCTGKSAQIPLAGWLPDAMAGPTSVSALIHAATMVTAGIFLIARNSVIFASAPDAMMVIAIVGAATALLAASIGLVQNDIKKVLAYSTVSQLGFMFAALGSGAWIAAIFHVMTHAFFKGLLFLGSGSVIHGMHEEQNIKKMGGLKKHMPITYKTFLVASIAISGIPFFSGFFSKDEILWKSYVSGGWFLWVTLALAAFFTAFYMFRLVYLTFHGKERFDADHVHPHESPKTMTIPLIVLAVLSAIGGFIGIPYALGFFFSSHPNILENFLSPVFAQADHILGLTEGHEVHAIEYIMMAASTVIAIIAILLARSIYKQDENWSKAKSLTKNFGFAYKVLWNKWYLDNFYYKIFVTPIFKTSQDFLWKIFDVNIVDGAVNGTAFLTQTFGKGLRRMQSGVAQTYLAVMMLGIIILIGYLIF